MENYKDKYKGKIGYILGTGPSLKTFKVTDFDAVYFGMNTCYLYDNIAPHLDILISEYYYEGIIIKKYNNNETFHHMLTDRKQMLWGGRPLKSLIDPTIPIFYDPRIECSISSLKKEKYTNTHPYDFEFLENTIGYAPGITRLYEQASTAYLTTLFAAYTGCSELKFIGCDCTGDLERLLDGWKGVKEILNDKYPDIKINNDFLFMSSKKKNKKRK